MAVKQSKETQKNSITIGFLYERNIERLKLTSLTGEAGFQKEIKDKNIHRPGLALAGYVGEFRSEERRVGKECRL